MKIQIENMDIWQCQDALYCKRSDGNLIKIQSNDNEKILEVVQYIQQNEEIAHFASENVSEKEFGEIIKFLLQNKIIANKQPEKTQKINIGFYGDDEVLMDLEFHFSCFGYNFSITHIENKIDIKHLNMIMVVAPVFDNYAFLQELSDSAYKSHIPLLYAEFSPTTFTLGPLVVPLKGTPSLSCYMKRKSVNLRNLALYSEFIETKDKKKCHSCIISDFSSYEIGLELLKMEIERFWQYKGSLSAHLMAKSITMDFANYKIEQSRILKDPLSPLFQRSTYAPFNG